MLRARGLCHCVPHLSLSFFPLPRPAVAEILASFCFSWLHGGVARREKRPSVPQVDGASEVQANWRNDSIGLCLKWVGTNTCCENIIRNLQNQRSFFPVNAKGLAVARPSHVFSQLPLRTSRLPLRLMGANLSRDWHSSPLLDGAVRFDALKSGAS